MSARSKNKRRRPVARNTTVAPAAPAAPVVVEAAEPETAVAEGPIAQLHRSDVLGACGVTVAAGVLFLSTFSTHVALGDAPESVSGVKTVGVLHAPGYPSYVAVANAFARVVPFGGWAARVNAFSLVCAALLVGAVFLLARSFGASRAGAVLGAFALASTASFWFNAAFAKHYAFSGLVVVLAALAVTQWHSGGRSMWLIVAGALLGVGAGALWQLAAIMAVGLVLLVVFGTRRPRPALIAGSIAALVIVAVGVYAFLLWRARRHPAVNWGEVTDLHRLVNQVTQQDFRGSNPDAHGNVAVRMAKSVPDYLAIVVRDVGLGAIGVALFGAIFGVRGLDRGRKLFLAAVGALNFVAVVLASTGPPNSSAVAGNDRILGFLTGMVAGGYVLDLLVVLAVLAAVGTTPLIDRASELAVGARTPPGRYRSSAALATERFRSGFTVALFAIVLVPSVLVHYHLADHRHPPLADNYARRVFAELPPHAALFVFQADLTFPLVYRQAVFGERPDVSVIITTSLQFDWYREQIARALELPSPVRAGPTDRQVQSLIDALRPARPVFIDTGMMQIYRSRYPFRLRGLVGEVVSRGADTSIDRSALADALIRDDRADGVAGHTDIPFPNGFVHFLYSRAHIELAKQFAAARQLEPARTEIARSLDDSPDPTVSLVLRFSGQKEEKLDDVVRVIQAM